MATRALSPEQQADIERLTREIHQAVNAEIGELAANLATTDDAHLFGHNEFKNRAIAHKIAAKAVETHLAISKENLRLTEAKDWRDIGVRVRPAMSLPLSLRAAFRMTLRRSIDSS